jgi:hypothetical protein
MNQPIFPNSLFRPPRSLLGRENSLFRSEQELGCKALERLDESTRLGAKMAANRQDSLIFSLFQGIRALMERRVRPGSGLECTPW